MTNENIETQAVEKQKPKSKISIADMLGELRSFLGKRFDLTEDQASQEEIEGNIRRNIEFKGTNLWILIFAIVVASVGLNVNSTAVIIGAMLISPLMGPIMGVGLALSVSDFDLLKRSLRNLLFAASVSLVASTLYFMASPLTIVQSELLARTSPTIWDVLIATFGGFAGIVAQTRQDRTTPVIPGVAIATALMPPLCTAGFGIASGEWQYFLGALYLFSINAVFIALSCFIIVRFVMRFETKQQLNPQETKRVGRIMASIVLIMIVPSCIMAYSIVQRTIFETSAKSFIRKVFVFEESEVVNSSIKYDPRGKGNSIEVVMVGEPLSEDAIVMANNQLPLFSLHGTKLLVRQINKSDNMDNATIGKLLKSNADIIDEKNNAIKKLESELAKLSRDTLPTIPIAREMGAIWPEIETIELSRSDAITTQGQHLVGGVTCIIRTSVSYTIDDAETIRVKNWLRQRTGIEEIRLIIE